MRLYESQRQNNEKMNSFSPVKNYVHTPNAIRKDGDSRTGGILDECTEHDN